VAPSSLNSRDRRAPAGSPSPLQSKLRRHGDSGCENPAMDRVAPLEALVGYLFGMHAERAEVSGRVVAVSSPSSHLLGESAFPAGLFRNADHSELSAVVFTNACAISKFNRVGVSAGALAKGLRYVRLGKFYDRTPGALDGIPFCLDITSNEYRRLWPQGYEPWSAELEIFHNPFAQRPLPRALLPEATHWFEADGEVICEAHYETSVLWSKTLIQNDSDPMPTLGDDLGNSADAAL
jgi:hypothetical protein